MSDILIGGTSYYAPLPTPEELIEWMAQVEMTRETLAVRLEVPIEYVNEILTGLTDPPIRTWFAIGKIIGMTNQEKSVTAQRNYAVAPGEYVTEWLEENHVTLSELAFDLGVNESYAAELVGGKMPIQPVELALALQELTGIPVKQWVALDRQYWKDRYRIEALAHQEREREARTRVKESITQARADRVQRRDELLGEIVDEDEALMNRLADER